MLNAFLWPAIKFMGRLNYAAKFGLISFLFTLPLVVLSGQVFLSAFETVKKTESELAAIEQIGRLISFSHDVELYRDHASVLPFLADAELDNKVKVHRQEMEMKIGRLIKESATEELQNKLKTWRSDYGSRLSTEGGNSQTVYSGQIQHYQTAVDELRLIIRQYAQSSGVSLDTDFEIQTLVSVLLNDMPTVQDAAGSARALGTYSMIEKYLKSGTYDLLNDSYDTLIAAEAVMGAVAASTENSGFLSLSEMAGAATSALEKIRIKLDDEVIAAASVEMNWQDYNKFLEAELARLTAIEDQVLPLIAAKLQQRLESQQSKVRNFVIVIAVVLSIIAYLYLAFFISIRFTIKRFSKTAGYIAEGDLTHAIKFNGKDEMGQLRDAFNGMVSNIRTTLSTVKDSASSVSSNVNDVEAIANRSRHAVQNQLEQTHQVSDALGAMVDRAVIVTSLAEAAEDAAKSGQEKSDEAGKVVTNVMNEVQRLSVEMENSMEAVNRLAENSTVAIKCKFPCLQMSTEHRANRRNFVLPSSSMR